MFCKSYFMRQAPNTNLKVRGPINAVSSWQSWKKAGYADGVHQAHLQAELDEIEEEDESGPVYEGAAVITEGLHVGQVHLQLFHGLQRHEAVVASLRPVLAYPEAVRASAMFLMGSSAPAWAARLPRVQPGLEALHTPQSTLVSESSRG